jgi:hypothetical protein
VVVRFRIRAGRLLRRFYLPSIGSSLSVVPNGESLLQRVALPDAYKGT